MSDQEGNDIDPTDPFDSLLSLEQQYYTEGYALGHQDGSRAGRIEGRLFGLEKGFEKFSELGKLRGRAVVWRARLDDFSPQPTQPVGSQGESVGSVARLEANERRTKQVRRLCDLTDFETLSTENDEDAVAEFDERLKHAKAKATLISKLMGEVDFSTATEGVWRKGGAKGMQATDAGKAHGSGEMEDFVGLPGAKMKDLK